MRRGMKKKIAASLLCVVLSASLLPQNILASEIKEEMAAAEEMLESEQEIRDIQGAATQELDIADEQTAISTEEKTETIEAESLEQNTIREEEIQEDLEETAQIESEMMSESTDESSSGDIAESDTQAEMTQEEQENLQQMIVKESAEEEMDTVAATTTVKNPRITPDSSMDAGQNVTWDCLYFGSYPQTEIKSGDSMYHTLQTATGWDSNNEIIISGEKYRRMQKSDATLHRYSGEDGYYNWSDSSTYHYFKYKPIKWRVLEVTGNKALLLSDIALDDQKYNASLSKVTWEVATIRGWLNENFLNSAFSNEEQTAIDLTELDNESNPYYGSDGGNDTSDKVFFLKASDAYTSKAISHGFVKVFRTYDEARRCKSSDYAKAMGIRSDTSSLNQGNCFWWIRTPGEINRVAVCVKPDGWFGRNGYGVADDYVGVRPALVLDLSKTALYKNAGTVNSKDVITGETNDCEHHFETKITKATPTEEGLISNRCSLCGYKMEEKIYSPQIQLSTTNYVYTGKAKKPTVTVTDTEGNIVDSSNYKVTYLTDRKSMGRHKVQVDYIGDYYAGMKTATFLINPKATTLKSVVSGTSADLTATWAAVSGVSGYEVQYSINTSFSGADTKYVNEASTLSRTIYKLTEGKRYYVRVRCFAKVDNVRYYSEWTSRKSAVISPKAVSLSSLTSTTAGKLTAKWAKNSYATGYELQYGTSSSFSGAKISDITSNATVTKTISSLTKGKKYYARVRAYTKIGSTKYYSAWSSAKSVTIKK